MSESDLDNLLSDLDIGDAEPEGGADSDASGLADDLAAADAGGGDDLGAALDDAGGGEGGTEEIDLGDMGAGEGGTEEIDLGDMGAGEGGTEEIDLGDMGAGEGGTEEIDLGGGEDEGEGMQISDDLAASLTDALGGEGEDAGGGDSGLGALAASMGTVQAGDQGVGEDFTPDLSGAGLVGVDEDSVNIEFLLDIKLHITFEVGRAKMLISDLLTLGQGSVIELHRLVGDELDLLINGKLVAKGEVVVVNEKFGCRITSIVPPEDRIKHLAGV